MSLLTLFTAPKPFRDPHIAVIQRNALRSWALLPDTDVLVIGEEQGLAEAAAELGLTHLPDVARNASGTPLVSSIFALARAHNDSPLLAYVNADILIMDDFVQAARRMAELRAAFLMVGRRIDLDLDQPLSFAPGWQDELRQMARREGRPHPPMGSDYFVFPRACFTEIPDFAIGRAGWDNWMLSKAVQERWDLTDTSSSVLIVHQNHDYSHLATKTIYGQPESEENIRMAGGRTVTRYSLADTDLELRNGQIRPARSTLPRILRRTERFLQARNTPPKRLFNILLIQIHRLRTLIQRAR